MFKEININSFMWILIVIAAISVITVLISGGILSVSTSHSLAGDDS